LMAANTTLIQTTRSQTVFIQPSLSCVWDSTDCLSGKVRRRAPQSACQPLNRLHCAFLPRMPQGNIDTVGQGKRRAGHARQRSRIIFGVGFRETFKSLFLGTYYSIFQATTGEIVSSLNGWTRKNRSRHAGGQTAP
jgi:hypothetical protein